MTAAPSGSPAPRTMTVRCLRGITRSSKTGTLRVRRPPAEANRKTTDSPGRGRLVAIAPNLSVLSGRLAEVEAGPAFQRDRLTPSNPSRSRAIEPYGGGPVTGVGGDRGGEAVAGHAQVTERLDAVASARWWATSGRPGRPAILRQLRRAGAGPRQGVGLVVDHHRQEPSGVLSRRQCGAMGTVSCG